MVRIDKKIDDHTFEVDRGLVRELVTSGVKPGAARILPVTENGELKGLRMFGVATNSSHRIGELTASSGTADNARHRRSTASAHLQSVQTLLDVYAEHGSG